MQKPSDEIIHNVLSGLGSSEEAASVAKWFATDEGQEYLSSDMDRYFYGIKENSEDIHIPHSIPSEKIWQKVELNLIPRRSKNHKKILLQIAAAIIPLFIVSFFAIQLSNYAGFGNAYTEEILVAKGETKQVIFQDGSSVYLNADSKLSYPKKFSLFSRKVKLEGEAYFEIEKNKARPFIVELNEATVKVLGTSFNVKSYSDDKEIRVSLDKGKIEFLANSKSYRLNPNEIIHFDKESYNVTTSHIKNNSVSSWKNNIIVFDNTPLHEIIHILNRWYGVEFHVEDDSAFTYSYTLTTRRIPLMFILADFEKISPLRFTLENDTVKIRMN